MNNNFFNENQNPIIKICSEEKPSFFINQNANATPSSYKNKKNLKLITPTNNNNLLSINNENETNKNKILTPQPENKVASVSPKHSNPLSCFTYPPSMKLETKNSLDNHDFMYKDEIFEVIMKKFGHKSQEDRFCAKLIKKRDPFFAVFDGHGNALSSSLLSDILYKYIENQPDYDLDINNSIINAFKIFDDELLSLLQKKNIKGGSTALCALIKKNILYVMNCGDSLAVMVGEKNCLRLNNEHTPQNEIERQKLDAKGAIVLEKKKVFRVLGELAVSRSFGDKNYKDFITSEPEILTFEIDLKLHDYLILASDGFWNVISVEKLHLLYIKWKNNKESLDSLSEFLLNEAIINDSEFKKDNMTIIVVHLCNLEKMKEYNNSKQDNKMSQNNSLKKFFDFGNSSNSESFSEDPFNNSNITKKEDEFV